jgi:DeoR family transcriptional regulator of aga operon
MGYSNRSRLLGEERRRKIVEQVERDGQATITDLARRFKVSAVTIRGDLDVLSTGGVLLRSHGGALKKQEVTQDFPLPVKATLHRQEKVRIGQAAARLIQPRETVILDSGTTTAEVAAQLCLLKTQPVTVITNALNIAMGLADAPGISVIVLGGLLRPVSHSLVGPHAESTLRDLHADRLFLAVDGFDIEAGPSTPDILEAQLNCWMVQMSKEVTVVADSSKLGRRSVSRIQPFDRIHRLITDKQAPADFVNALRRRRIEVILV